LAGQLAQGEISLDRFLKELARPRTADLGEVQLDLDRSRRCGYPEVVFGEGKTVATLAKIFRRLLATGADAFGTRIGPDAAADLVREFPAGRYNPVARTFCVPAGVGDNSPPRPQGRVTVVTAGTTDLPVAEEAAETARWMGAAVSLVADVGVAGPHRLPSHLETIRAADAVVVVAGMEGALASVVGGLTGAPVVAVPTSVGYGASLEGVTALLAMLASCAAGLVVVGIDNGFGAACAVARILGPNPGR